MKSDTSSVPPSPVWMNDLIHRLRLAYPEVRCELNYQTPVQLLVATILSAQCTDVRVNQVTPALFARFPTAVDLAAADRSELEQLIYATGFYRQKARYIQEACHIIVTKHGGVVPDEMEKLLELSGVARKTANVVLGEIYKKAEGVTVDTHVKRLSGRLGLTRESDPVKVEQDLMKIVPRQDWIDISHLLIWHGRRVCYARNPNCASCLLNDICPASVVSEGSVG